MQDRRNDTDTAATRGEFNCLCGRCLFDHHELCAVFLCIFTEKSFFIASVTVNSDFDGITAFLILIRLVVRKRLVLHVFLHISRSLFFPIHLY